jgi:hypothetical protein
VPEWDVAVRGDRHVHDLRATLLLRVPDLRVRRKLEIADHDLVALAAEIESARDGIDAGGSRSRDSDLIGRALQYFGHEMAHGLVLHDPNVPVLAHCYAVVHVIVESRANTVGERAISATVEIRLALEQGKLAAQRGEIGSHEFKLSSGEAMP